MVAYSDLSVQVIFPCILAFEVLFSFAIAHPVETVIPKASPTQPHASIWVL